MNKVPREIIIGLLTGALYAIIAFLIQIILIPRITVSELAVYYSIWIAAAIFNVIRNIRN